MDEIIAVAERSNFNTKKLQTILNKSFVFVIDDLLGLVSRHLGVPRETMEESLSHHKTTDGGFKTKSSLVVKQHADVQTPALFPTTSSTGYAMEEESEVICLLDLLYNSDTVEKQFSFRLRPYKRTKCE